MKEEIDFHEMEARCFSVCWILGSCKGEERERERGRALFFKLTLRVPSLPIKSERVLLESVWFKV